MDEKIANELLQRLDALTAKLGVGAEALWHILVRQAVIASWVDLAACGAMIVGWIAMWRVAKRVPNLDNEDLRGIAWAGLGIGAFGLALASAVALCSFSNIVTGIVNPEYRAFQSLVKPK